MFHKDTLYQFFNSLFGFHRKQSIQHIVLIVLVHAAAWALLFLIPLLLFPFRITASEFIERELLDKILLIVLFYLHYYYLIPRFFERKKYLLFSVLVTFCFLFYFLVILTSRGNNFFIHARTGAGNRGLSSETSTGFAPMQQVLFPAPGEFGPPEPPEPGVPVIVRVEGGDPGFVARRAGIFNQAPFILGFPKPLLIVVLNRAGSSFLILLLVAGFIRLCYSFIRNQNEKKALENANLNAEVNLLKSQINPHFLFNTLNSIYSQAHARSDKTEFSILKLSELLRYVIYESATDRVPLENDVQYIHNFIELQRLRLPDRIQPDYRVTGNLEEKVIAPMLLICFIENAFKHGISYTTPSTIKIHLDIENENLFLYVNNPIVENDNSIKEGPGGMGIPNVRRRLELLYPGRHELSIQKENRQHTVHLKINLAHD